VLFDFLSYKIAYNKNKTFEYGIENYKV